MTTFKFLNRKNNIDFRQVFVDYTNVTNSKIPKRLNIAYEGQTENNYNLRTFMGTFLQFKNFIHRSDEMDWDQNMPVIHSISFYSKRFHNRQAYYRLTDFREYNIRFGKNQNLKIYYEVI